MLREGGGAVHRVSTPAPGPPPGPGRVAPSLSGWPGTLSVMAARTFVFHGGTSDKFWSIDVSGPVHTVHYGRTGTAGQTKSKQFPDAAAAGAAATALVAEKVRKGYVEQAPGAGAASPPAPAATPTPAATPVPQPAPAPAAPSAPSVPPAAGLASRIDLFPHEWAYASWRPVAAAPGPPPVFDPVRAGRALQLVTTYDRGVRWGWSGAPFEGPLSAQEAAAWLWATHREGNRPITPADARKRFADPDAAHRVQERDPFTVACLTTLPPGLALECLLGIMAPGEVAARLVGDDAGRPVPSVRWHSAERRSELVHGVRAFLLPRLAPAERDALAADVRAKLSTVAWPTDLYQRPDVAFLLAAQLGLHDEVRAEVDSWPDDRYRGGDWWDHYHQPQALVFGLGSPGEVVDALTRLALPFRYDWHVAAFLAHTGTAELPFAAARVAQVGSKDDAAALLDVLARVHDVGAVAPMLELLRTSRAPATARAWLAAHPLEALVGAARLLSRSGRARDQALDLLRARKRTGADVGAALPFLDAADAARLSELVLEHDDGAGRDVGPEELAPELARALADADAAPGRRRLPAWIDVPALPPVVVDGRGRLPDAAVSIVLGAALALRPGDAAPPLLAAVRAHCDSDALAWALVEAWLGEGAPPGGRWAFLAAGFLGGDRTATRLAPLVRAWPGESQHQRAVLGLGVLGAIGSDTALMLLSGIAQKVKFKGLQGSAREAMDRIAQAKGMTKAELEDRIVPDGGLDEQGARTFDFGPRQFAFVLGPGMRPMVRDAAGRVRTALPKPNAKDDPALAAAAAAEWKLLRKIVGDLVAVQATRLEQAMVTQRRWSVADADRFLVRHPLQRHLARLLVWGAWRPDGSLAATFRVTDELDLADADDEPFTPAADHLIGVVHPLQLSADAGAAWGELLADYGIVPPFAQLGRPVHDVDEDERAATDLTRFAGRALGAAAMVRVLENLGWERGAALDNGIFSLHAKPFPALGVTAVVEYEGVPMGYMVEWEDQSIEHCYVLGRTVGSAHDLGWGAAADDPGTAWGEVDPIVRSEVLADLHALVDRAGRTAP